MIFKFLIAAILISALNACEPPDCDRKDCGSCGNSCCNLEFLTSDSWNAFKNWIIPQIVLSIFFFNSNRRESGRIELDAGFASSSRRTWSTLHFCCHWRFTTIQHQCQFHSSSKTTLLLLNEKYKFILRLFAGNSYDICQKVQRHVELCDLSDWNVVFLSVKIESLFHISNSWCLLWWWSKLQKLDSPNQRIK